MISGFLVKKLHLDNQYDDQGQRFVVTYCEAQPLTVTQVKTIDKDGYQAVQVGYFPKKHLSQPLTKRLKKAKISTLLSHYREFAPTSETLPEVGSTISIDQVFSANDSISVSAVSKGRGFTGVIKRHRFHRQPVTGGQSDRVRAPGSIGAQTPGKVLRGKRMPGHYGNVLSTVKNLRVVSVDPANNLLVIAGPVPGSRQGYLLVTKSKLYK